MASPEDPSQSRLEHVMEVYDAPETHRAKRYAGLSPRLLGIAVAIALSHAVALLTGQYAVVLALLVVMLVGVGAVVTDRIPDPARGWSR